ELAERLAEGRELEPLAGAGTSRGGEAGQSIGQLGGRARSPQQVEEPEADPLRHGLAREGRIVAALAQALERALGIAEALIEDARELLAQEALVVEGRGLA